MKAAVLHQLGANPVYEDYEAPVPQNDQQVLLNMKASAIKQLDKAKVSGAHYTSYRELPVVIGTDGVGTLQNGTPVYGMGITGMLAEKALADKSGLVPLPDSLDLVKAAALPNALLGSDAALLYRARIKSGETVLVNGATGVTGKVAIQIARNRGASAIIATGRNAKTLEALKALGADHVLSLREPEGTILERLKEIQDTTPVDIVLDYLWGQPMETILKGLAAVKPHRTRVILLGEMAGADLLLASGMLRSSKIELLGSGFGSLSSQEIAGYMQNEMSEALELAAAGKLRIDTEACALKDIGNVWEKEGVPGKRRVITV